MGRRRLRVLVAGRLTSSPAQGGAAWAVLQYVLGLERLGHEVLLVEPLSDTQAHDRVADFRAITGRFGLGGRAAVVDPADHSALTGFARRTDVLLNLSGVIRDLSQVERIPVRVYVDLDPVFTQLWHAQGIEMGLDGHTHHATVGRALGGPDCAIPTGGLAWLPLWPPVVLAHWPAGEELRTDALTTVANWRSYGSIHHQGVHYGQKAHALRPLIELPRQIGERCVLALAIDPAEKVDLEALRSHGWERVDPSAVAGTPDDYRAFVAGSWAELGIAKSGYVVSRSGWFSDRSACYLASGRPVIAQETGFSRWLPTGQGLFSFDDAADVRAAAAAIRADYPSHRRAARAIAEEWFDSDRVLGGLLRAIGATG